MTTYGRKGKRGLRRSQAITTFGPGAIVDLPEASIMVAGLPFWPDSAVRIHEPNLEKLLNVEEFRMPPTDGADAIPAVLFPEWYVCPLCHRLAPYDVFNASGTHRPGTHLKCPSCRKSVYPARLIVACPRGHIDDFPWLEWTHRDYDLSACHRPQLFLYARGFTSALADIKVECRSCGAETHLGGATRREKLEGLITCSGRRPWLNDHESCGGPVYPLQRGASNVFFSVQGSAISIPPWSQSMFARLDTWWNVLGNPGTPEHILRQLVPTLDLPRTLGLTLDDVMALIMQRRAFAHGGDEAFTEEKLRYDEVQAIRRGTTEYDPDSEFMATPAPLSDTLQPYFSDVVLLERLREVRAIRGFTRIEAPDPASRLQVKIAPIAHSPAHWLPAVEMRGEGIYLQLNEQRLLNWIVENDEVSARAGMLNQAYLAMCAQRGWEPSRPVTPRFLLVHSLAHALIRQLAIESGYASASLRERLYVFEPDDQEARPGVAGLLVYTSTPDSEGSLGGLVRQGEKERLAATISSAIEDASWCSSDPLCIESEGQGPDAVNLAACHACLLASETSCEEFNRFLDRALLTGTLDDPAVGYFHGLLEP